MGRTVKGSELARLMEVQKAAAPDFVWQLLDWTSRGDVVIIEAKVIRLRSRMGLLKGDARVNGRVAVEGTMTFALGPARQRGTREHDQTAG